MGAALTYVMGNHDRLINTKGYEKIREIIRNSLGLKPDQDEMFPWKYPSGDLPIYAIHGNDYDVYNTTINMDNYKDPTSDPIAPIGDAIVTLLINQYPEKIYSKVGNNDIREKLREIDNLRPATIAPFWIYHVGQGKKDLESILHKEWRNLLDTFSENEFVKSNKKLLELKIALNFLTSVSAGELYEKYSKFINKPDTYVIEAFDLIKNNKYDYVLFGHTHESCTHLLVVKGRKKSIT